jgi:hypothetical protein
MSGTLHTMIRRIALTLCFWLAGCSTPLPPVVAPVAPLCSHTESGPPGCVCAQHYTDEDLLHFKVPCP